MPTGLGRNGDDTRAPPPANARRPPPSAKPHQPTPLDTTGHHRDCRARPRHNGRPQPGRTTTTRPTARPRAHTGATAPTARSKPGKAIVPQVHRRVGPPSVRRTEDSTAARQLAHVPGHHAPDTDTATRRGRLIAHERAHRPAPPTTTPLERPGERERSGERRRSGNRPTRGTTEVRETTEMQRSGPRLGRAERRRTASERKGQKRQDPRQAALTAQRGSCYENSGNVLLSQTVSHLVPSALRSLTSEFGMRSGGASSL